MTADHVGPRTYINHIGKINSHINPDEYLNITARPLAAISIASPSEKLEALKSPKFFQAGGVIVARPFAPERDSFIYLFNYLRDCSKESIDPR